MQIFPQKRGRSAPHRAHFFDAYIRYYTFLEGSDKHEAVQSRHRRRDRHGRSAFLPAAGESSVVRGRCSRRFRAQQGQDLRRGLRGPLEDDRSDARQVQGHGHVRRNRRRRGDRLQGRFHLLRGRHEEGRDPRSRGKVCEARVPGLLQQLRTPFYPGRSDDHSGDQCRPR